MLPTSRRLFKKDVQNIDDLTLGDIERYYKKHGDATDATDATDARDNLKIRISKNNNDNRIDLNSESIEDILEEEDGEYFSELTPSFIESTISNSMGTLFDDQYDKHNPKLSVSKYNLKHIKYPFSDKNSNHLSHDLDEIYSMNTPSDSGEITVELCIYYINNTAYKPFLEFLLYKSKDDDTLYFPNFTQKLSQYDLLENVSLLLSSLFENNKFMFKGRIVESENMNKIQSAYINKRVILLYELKEKEYDIKRLKKDDPLWWATVCEIFNFRKLLFYDISDTVIDIFLCYTQMIKLFYKNSLVETPMVVFNGSNTHNTRYNAIFSMNKSSNESRYGPFYYFTDLYSSMKYSCYDKETHEKYKKGGLVKFIIYPGKIKMFLKKDKPDRSKMAKYIYSKHPIERVTSQFRDNDCLWTEHYNSAYNGRYTINMSESQSTKNEYDSEDNDLMHTYDIPTDISKNSHTHGDSRNKKHTENDSDSENEKNNVVSSKDKKEKKYHLAMRICIDDYIFQTPLSYYFIDTTNIPKKYEIDFKKYKIV